MDDPVNAEEVYLRYIKKRSDTDLETLLITFRDGLFLFLLSFVKSEEDAEELLMDTFALLAVNRPHYDPKRSGSFKSWLYAIARNNALMHIRKGKMKTVPLEEEMVSDEAAPESVLLNDERNRKLYLALYSLNPEYRRALMLLYIEELSREEIAEAMGINIRRVYNLLDRGKKTLRKTLEGMGIYDTGN